MLAEDCTLTLPQRERELDFLKAPVSEDKNGEKKDQEDQKDQPGMR